VERVASLGGVTLAVDVIGSGEPVTVVAHGLTGSRHDLAPLAPVVPGTAILFDFRGHGESDRPGTGAYSMEDFAADLDAVSEAYGATRLVGVSLGGGAALRLLARRPDRFERLVFVLPARVDPGSPAGRRLLRLAARLEAAEVAEVATEVIAEEEQEGEYGGELTSRETRRLALLRMNGEGVPRAIREALHDPPLRDPTVIRRVTAPALVIGQGGDPVHTAEAARNLADALPNAELILYPSRAALVSDMASLATRVAAFLDV
jgi:pimeloyl-ACP methyl ester carboxylesterase